MRKRREFIRKSAYRDAKLVIIATEDTQATPRYFQALCSPAYYQNPKVHVCVLESTNTSSGPAHVLARLKAYQNEYELGDGDELWLVIDVDEWGESKLSQVTRESSQANHWLAVSNPCIELWFLLHLIAFENYTDDQLVDLLKNPKVNKTRRLLEHEIINLVGRYDKSNLAVDDFLPYVEDAIQRAEELDINPQDRWPQGLGTHVYRLVKSILDK